MITTSHTIEFRLTAAEVDWRLQMPLSSLVVAIIDIATAHANRLGVGYSDMMKTNTSWVLSRLAMDIHEEMPRYGQLYRMTTWVTAISRLFSDRCFEICAVEPDGSDGPVVVSAASVWMAIDMTTRRPSDLTLLSALTACINPRECRAAAPAALRPFDAAETAGGFDYQVKTSDIDVNRHLTSRRYVDLMVDCIPLDEYDRHPLRRFEIAFKRECRYGEAVRVMRSADGRLQICGHDGGANALAKMTF